MLYRRRGKDEPKPAMLRARQFGSSLLRGCFCGVTRIAFVLWLSLLGVQPAGAVDAALSTRDLKAAILLRLVDFVTWPASGHGGSFSLCVVADKALAETLTAPARGLRVDGAPVEVRHYAGLQQLSGCRLVFIGAYDESKVKSYLAKHANQPVFTVGETEEFLNFGGMLRIRIEAGKVQLELNQSAASSAGLGLSSRLLRLAGNSQRNP